MARPCVQLRQPLVPAWAGRANAPRDPLDAGGALYRSPEGIGASVEGVAQTPDHGVKAGQAPPDPLAPGWVVVVGGQRDLLLTKPADALVRAAQLAELGEDQADGVPHALVRMFLDPALLSPDVASGEGDDQLPAARLMKRAFPGPLPNPPAAWPGDFVAEGPSVACGVARGIPSTSCFTSGIPYRRRMAIHRRMLDAEIGARSTPRPWRVGLDVVLGPGHVRVTRRGRARPLFGFPSGRSSAR